MATEALARTPYRLAAAPPHSERWIEPLFRGSIVVLGIATLAIVWLPIVHGHAVAPAFDLALDTLALIVSLAVTVLAWTRFREWRASIALFQAAAFLCLGVAYAAAVVISLGRDGDPASLADPNPIQAYVFALSRALAATMLVAGGTRIGTRAAVRRPGLTFVGPGLGLLAITAIAAQAQWVVPEPLWIARPDPDGSGLPATTSLGAAIQVGLAALLFLAAFVCLDRWRRDRSIGDGWMALGLVVAAFAEIHWIAYPAGHPGQVSAADLLRLVFFVVLLLGIEAEARSVMARLRAANLELAELRESDVERAALEERARLARELHDGLAQDLWLAKLKAGQLSAMAGLPASAMPLVSETEAAIDTGLAEARQAVMALRLSADERAGFAGLLGRYIEDFEDRFGLRVEFTASGDGQRVAPRVQAEVLRIAQEGLVNARQHADATVVGVSLDVEGDRLILRVADNGRGFDASRTRRSSFGLAAMRERAALIGGRLRIESRLGEGTRIVLVAPLGASSPGSRESLTAGSRG